MYVAALRRGTVSFRFDFVWAAGSEFSFFIPPYSYEHRGVAAVLVRKTQEKPDISAQRRPFRVRKKEKASEKEA